MISMARSGQAVEKALRPSLRAPHFVGPPDHGALHDYDTATFPEGAPNNGYHFITLEADLED